MTDLLLERNNLLSKLDCTEAELRNRIKSGLATKNEQHIWHQLLYIYSNFGENSE